MTTNRDFKGIWIPKEVWLNENLTIIEKLFLVEIDSLDNDNGCYASNKYFSNFFNVSKGRCTQVIKSLERKGLVKITYEREGKEIVRRIIRVVNKLNTLVNILNTPVNKLNPPSKKIKQGYLENDEENNTKINNTKINNKSEKALSSNLDSIPHKEIIDYLNEKAKCNYKYTTNKTRSLIKARCEEGFSIDDFKKVTDIKVAEWENNEMSKYLRPETLFGNKFESYLNQKPINKGNYENENDDRYSDLPI